MMKKLLLAVFLSCFLFINRAFAQLEINLIATDQVALVKQYDISNYSIKELSSLDFNSSKKNNTVSFLNQKDKLWYSEYAPTTAASYRYHLPIYNNCQKAINVMGSLLLSSCMLPYMGKTIPFGTPKASQYISLTSFYTD